MSGATVDLGNIKFNWKGPWTNSTAYVVNDTVFSSPHGYVCITAHTSHASDANLATSDSAYWNQMTAGSTTGLPDQTGQAGEYLKTDGATATWEAIVSDPTMGGDLTGTASNAQIAADAVTASEIAAGAVGTSEIAANAVTLAEMAGLARGSIIYGNASGDPTALTKGSADQVLTSDGTDLSWAAVAGGGITVGDQWRLTTNFSGTTNPITSNLERVDTPQQATLGSAMTESSGVFTFPETGYYLITAAMCGGIQNATERSHGINISVTINNSTWANVANATANGFDSNDETTYSARCRLIVDVTSTANVKVRFYASTVNGSSVTKGSSTTNLTTFTFLRLADT